MSGHDHHHHASGGRALLLSLVLTTAFAAVEAVGGWLSGSLALLSDAGHMITDSSSLAIGAFAAWLATRPVSRRHSFGLQRAEVLGALVNVVFMFGVVALVAASAVQRLAEPREVAGGVVMVIGGLGLLVNLIVAWILTRGAQTMNVRGALLHVMGDLLGSVAAVTSGLVILLTGWMPIDPLLSLFVALLILVSAGRLLREVLHVLMEGVPRELDAEAVSAALTGHDGVRAVHDLHIWALSSHHYALSAHVDVRDLESWRELLPRLQETLRRRFGITHSTLQPEDDAVGRNCDSVPGCGLEARP
ncbi:cation diffusion facilitator family transporter [Salinisphaera sp. PC39]|uniref:cation diffusion facilitator family transporter n=1 Tax=Salinisphaera sp. PC39 TaxID=1304156 RepID=UPI00334206C5